MEHDIDETNSCNSLETDDTCLFCKIIRGEIPSTKAYEDDVVYAFNDIEPKAKVHVLIVPKRHYPDVVNLAQLSPATLAHIVEVAKKIASDAFHGEFRLIFNTGTDAGQSVFHAHAHVLTGEVLGE